VGTWTGLGQEMLARPDVVLELAAKWLYVRGRDGVMRPLVANAAQREFERRRGRQNIVLKARQMGMTTWIAGRFLLKTMLVPGTVTVQVAHTQAAAEAIFCIVRRMVEWLPERWRDALPEATRVSAGRIVFGEIESEYRVCSAADENAGRGLSLQNLHCSEVSRWPGDAAATMAGLRAALAQGGEMVLESTANGAYGAFYEEWLKAEWMGGEVNGLDGNADSSALLRNEKKGLMCDDKKGLQREGRQGLVRHFFPWWSESAYVGERVELAEMRAEELALVDRWGLSAEQIGFRRGLESDFGVLRLQEFAEDAESCFRATGACCFDVEAIAQRIGEAQEPVERRRGGALLVWFRAVPGKTYCVAVDTTGGGDEGDFAAVQVVEMATGLQCAELQERLRPAELARVVAELVREYGGAVVAVERNNHGAAVLAYLETAERCPRVWRARGEREDGWLTTSASKAEMVARMERLLRGSAGMFMSRRLLGECRTFVAGERGKMGAARGRHDDLVMAMGVAQAVRAAEGYCS
jgi:hypothetical protein